MSTEKGLRREIGLLTLISISAGAVIGGWVAEAPYWFKLTGAGAALLFPIIGVLLIPVGLAIAELTSMMPYAAGPLAFTTVALGRDVGFWCHWMFFLVQVVEPPLISFIFATVVNYFAGGTSFLLVKGLTVGFLVLWFIISMYRIGFIGKLSNFIFLIMLTGSVIVGLSFFLSGRWTTANIGPYGGWFPSGWSGVALGTAVLVLKFIGFELVPSSDRLLGPATEVTQSGTGVQDTAAPFVVHNGFAHVHMDHHWVSADHAVGRILFVCHIRPGRGYHLAHGKKVPGGREMAVGT